MPGPDNTATVQEMYGAFGRGDIQTLLGYLAEDVEWQPIYGTGSQVPTAGERRGKAAVAEFFALLSQHETFSVFEAKEFIASGDKVVALGRYAATTSKNTSFESDFAMVFTLRDGKVTRFKEFCDSAAINAAFPSEA